MRALLFTGVLVAATLTSVANAVEENLQNDSFVSGSLATFQGGFISGEIGAARFVPQIACPCVVEKVSLLFGGAVGSREMGINIWEDDGTDIPGALLFTGDVTLTGSNQNIHEIDLTLSTILVNGPFRVGFEFNQDGLPSLATDVDGNIDETANFIQANVGGFLFWFRSATLGVSGDFIIRATIDNLVAEDSDADGIVDLQDNCTNAQNPNQEDADGDAFGNICDADLNNDCIVNAGDLGLLRAAFFSSDGMVNWNAAADLNSDGVVNVIDLGLLRTLFFAPPGPSGLTDICD